jgi:hypothetical protein
MAFKWPKGIKLNEKNYGKLLVTGLIVEALHVCNFASYGDCELARLAKGGK